MNYKNILKEAVDASSDTTEYNVKILSKEELANALSAVDYYEVTNVELPLAELEKISYDPPSDEDIASNAEKSLESYYNEGVSSIMELANEEQKLALEEIEKRKVSANDTLTSIEAEYADMLKLVEDDAIKRGIARSSIAQNNVTGLASAAAEVSSEVLTSLDADIAKLESDISQLEVDRQSALDSFNIAYASKVTEEIAKLTAERDEKIEEVTKYNNEIEQANVDAIYDKASTESDLKTEQINQLDKLGNNLEADKMHQKYDIIKNYLSNLSGKEARTAVMHEEIIRSSLSDYYYHLLCDEYL